MRISASLAFITCHTTCACVWISPAEEEEEEEAVDGRKLPLISELCL